MKKLFKKRRRSRRRLRTASTAAAITQKYEQTKSKKRTRK